VQLAAQIVVERLLLVSSSMNAVCALGKVLVEAILETANLGNLEIVQVACVPAKSITACCCS